MLTVLLIKTYQCICKQNECLFPLLGELNVFNL